MTLRQREILTAMVESNLVPDTIQEDYVTSQPLFDGQRKNFYRVCYEFVNGRWEGFVSIVTDFVELRAEGIDCE